ncbi:ATP synthase F1 subunit gamma [Candidatus Gracilibacteria bacterium]|nr:ATP synthase F1 subunit gamma [Candidatus Gracilibacteria bacterium]
MASGKEIKARIKSIKNTSKITKAMELISTVKMKKAQESVLSLRPFALAALEILARVSHEESVLGVYGTAPDTTHELIILVAAQKGLCGGYNVNVFKKATEYIRDDIGTPYTREYDYITIGKRSRDFILRTGQSLLADFSDEIRDPLTIAESRRMVRFAISEWKTGKYSKLSIIYNHYVSALTQLPVVKTLFPINRADITTYLTTIAGTIPLSEMPIAYTIEPDVAMIVDYTIPMVLDAMIHETLLESRASEHAARMVAMKNAKDSANKKGASLTLIYNKARQGAITKEVSEIVSGVESMKDI